MKEAAQQEGKTLIGVLASHDSPAKHLELAETMQKLLDSRPNDMDKFHFVFTGGTFERLVLGKGCPDLQEAKDGLAENDSRFPDLRKFLREHSTALPDRVSGGLVLLANLVIHHKCELLWLFLSPDTPHWMNCQNMALLRLSDQCFAKKYMNGASVLRWGDEETERDVDRNPQPVNPLVVQLGTGETQGLPPGAHCPEKDPKGEARERETDCFPNCEQHKKRESPCRPWPRAVEDPVDGYWSIPIPTPSQEKRDWKDYGSLSIALIAHDAVKPRMVDFATQYERELMRFKRILTTGTTGSKIKERCHDLRSADKISLCQSGPYGGDLEIAAEVLFDRCQVVVFFVDPLHPHPHTDDIRVVFAVCMGNPTNNKILMLSNELQAKEWFDTIRFRSCEEQQREREQEEQKGDPES